MIDQKAVDAAREALRDIDVGKDGETLRNFINAVEAAMKAEQSKPIQPRVVIADPRNVYDD